MPTTYAESNTALRGVAFEQSSSEKGSVPLLFMCDFPPSNLRGGSVLISRLLEDQQNEVVVLTGSYFDKVSPREGRLSSRQIVFPSSNETGRWGTGRLKTLLNWFGIPFLAVVGLWVVKSKRIGAIVSIAHGHFFVAAALVSRFTKTPLVLMVHDDWVAGVLESSLILKYFCEPVFRFVAKQASHSYAVTPYMSEMLARKYGMVAEVQMPAIEPGSVVADTSAEHKNSLRFIYAGTLTGATDDSFNLFLELIKGDKLLAYGISDWELQLFVLATPEEVTNAGWHHARIKFRGWASQSELAKALSEADLFFLPFSFREEARFATEQAFPSKTADYLKAGKPILIFAPPYSSLAKYARELGFAEIVDRPDQEALAAAVGRIWNSSERRRELIENSRKALHANHDINKQRADLKAMLNTLVYETNAASIPSNT